MKLKSLILICSLCASPLFAQNKYYVNANSGNDTNDGTRWSKAFATLQPALEKAVANDEIWVAAGTYLPTKSISDTINKDQFKSFILPRGVKLYGGFPAQTDDNTGMGQRNWEAYHTILSGDFSDDDENFANMDENAYHVLILIEANNQTVVDGFTITGGNANDSQGKTIYINSTPVYNNSGGGIYACVINGSLETSPTLNNVVIEYNKAAADGAGIFNKAEVGVANPVITNAIIRNNKAVWGAGFFNNAVTKASPVLTNVIISGNEADRTGGGIYCYSEREITAPVLTNVLISGNKAKDAGGMYCSSLDSVAPDLTNVTIVGNKATDDAGGFACDAIVGQNGISSPIIRNSVIWGNKSAEFPNIYNYGYTGSVTRVYYSLIQGESGSASTGNLDGSTDPEFVSPTDADFAPTTEGNYQPSKLSPLINKGNNAFISVSKDLNGKTRIIDTTVDIGAYEYPETGGGPTSNEYISIGDNQLWASGGYLYVKIKESTTIRVYTVDGILVYQENQMSEGTKTISLPTGIYFVSLNDSTKAKIYVSK